MRDTDTELRHLALVLAQKHTIDSWNMSVDSKPTANDVVTTADTFHKFLTKNKGNRP